MYLEGWDADGLDVFLNTFSDAKLSSAACFDWVPKLKLHIRDEKDGDRDVRRGLMQTLIAAILAVSYGEGPPVDGPITAPYSEAVKAGYRKPFLEFRAERLAKEWKGWSECDC